MDNSSRLQGNDNQNGSDMRHAHCFYSTMLINIILVRELSEK